MATAPEKAPPNETWRGWLPDEIPSPDDDELITRDQLLAIVNDQGIKISVSDLRYWERLGVVPRPVRKWHNGATRALYPTQMITAIKEVRRLQRHGLSLGEIGPRVRDRFAFACFVSLVGADNLEASLNAFRATLQMNPGIGPHTEAALRTLAEEREQLTGIPTTRIEVRLIGKDGRKTVYHIDPLPPQERPTES